MVNSLEISLWYIRLINLITFNLYILLKISGKHLPAKNFTLAIHLILSARGSGVHITLCKFSVLVSSNFYSDCSLHHIASEVEKQSCFVFQSVNTWISLLFQNQKISTITQPAVSLCYLFSFDAIENSRSANCKFIGMCKVILIE